MEELKEAGAGRPWRGRSVAVLHDADNDDGEQRGGG